ncbi:MAG: hypothetical protein GY702_16030, partial [Desulfobulbaceae bacterium]|nr:hypothetical protein [Desulfobulbaceae bacterium]
LWTEPPSWYLWPTQDNVTFHLRLMEVEQWNSFGLGSYLIHGYPQSINQKTIATLPDEQQKLLTPEFLDTKTATPHFEQIACFHQTFILGEITIVVNTEGEVQLLCSSPLNSSSKQSLSTLSNMMGAMFSFQQKKSPHKTYTLNSRIHQSTIVVYEPKTLPLFTKEFQILDEELIPLTSEQSAPLLTSLAHAEAKSSMAGTCGCCTANTSFPIEDLIMRADLKK